MDEGTLNGNDTLSNNVANLSAVRGDQDRSTYHPSLDGLRGIAALMVVYGHAGYHGWVPLLVGCATIGVVLFFFLSGFLMGHHYLPDASAKILGRASLTYWKSFLVRRFIRVYPPYLLAPLVGYLVLFPLLPPDFEKTASGTGYDFGDLLHFISLDGNLGIYWTIKVELLFYAVYPLIITIYLALFRTPFSLLLMFALLAFLNHFPEGIGSLAWNKPLHGLWSGQISIFIAGILTAVMAKRGRHLLGDRSLPWNTLALVSVAGFIVAVAVICSSGPTQELYLEAGVAVRRPAFSHVRQPHRLGRGGAKTAVQQDLRSHRPSEFFALPHPLDRVLYRQIQA